MLRIAITGAAGRMGKTLIEACQQAEGCELSASIITAKRSWLPFIASSQVQV